MSEVIQCPTCSKKFRLPDRPPAEFTCTSCQTVMDLSAFGGVPAAAAVAPAAGGAGSPTTRRNRARGGGGGGGRRRSRGGGGAARGRSRGGRGRAAPQDDYDDEEEGGYRGRGRQQQNNNALIWGSLAALVVAGVLVFAFAGGNDKKPDDDGDVAKQGDPAAGSGNMGMVPGVGPANPAPGTGVTPLPGGVPAAPGTAPAPGATKTPATTKPPRPGARSGIRMKDIKLAIYEWPEEVDAATRAAAPEKLVSLIDGGRDGIEAEEWFINQGNKVAGFLISQFKKIDDEKGFQDRMAMTEVMVLDRTLCKMDGYLARKWNSTDMITHVSTEKYARARLKRWNAWWMRGYWKQHTKPWDPRVDEVDPDAPKPEDVEGRGFGGEKDK